MSIEIPVPKVEKQQMIAEATEKITVINKKLLKISEDFTVNPLNVNTTLEKLNTLIDQFGSFKRS